MCLTTSARSQQHPRCWRRQHPPCPAPSPPSTNSGATQHGCLPRQPPHPTPPGWGPCHGGGAVPHPRGGSIGAVTAGRGCLDTLAYDHRQHEPKGQARGVVVESPPPGGPWVGRCPRRPRRCRPPWEPPLGGRPGDSACAQSGRQGGGGVPKGKQAHGALHVPPYVGRPTMGAPWRGLDDSPSAPPSLCAPPAGGAALWPAKRLRSPGPAASHRGRQSQPTTAGLSKWLTRLDYPSWPSSQTAVSPRWGATAGCVWVGPGRRDALSDSTTPRPPLLAALAARREAEPRVSDAPPGHGWPRTVRWHAPPRARRAGAGAPANDLEK